MAIRTDEAIGRLDRKIQAEFNHEVGFGKRGPISMAILPLNDELLRRAERIKVLEAERSSLQRDVERLKDMLTAALDTGEEMKNRLHDLLQEIKKKM